MEWNNFITELLGIKGWKVTWKGFQWRFKEHCHSVQIIYDKFHIVRHLLNALNEVRKEEFRKAGEGMRELLCGKKFILLSCMENLKGDAKAALKYLLKVNRRLYKAYLLKESFGQLWSYTSRTWAMKFWDKWKEQLKWMGYYFQHFVMRPFYKDGIDRED